MKLVRTLAHILYHIARIAAFFYLSTAAYATVILLLKGKDQPGWLPFHSLPDGSFQIYYPFTHTPFMQGDDTFSFMLIVLLVTWGYGLFLWLLSGVFSAFRQKKLFVQKGVRRLSRFYIANLSIPVMILVAFALSGISISEIMFITLLHGVLGIFAFFMAAIFKQGLVLQEEQDLTL
jgi:hypothetical protein